MQLSRAAPARLASRQPLECARANVRPGTAWRAKLSQRVCILASSAATAAAEASRVMLDAQRRQMDTLARRARYEAERVAEAAAEASGQSWWEVDCPPNMVNVTCLEDLKTLVEGAGDQLVVVNFFAPECYACKSLQPKLRQIARGNEDVLFLKVNGLVGDLQGYVELMQIDRIPFFHMYRSNKRVAAFSANMQPAKLQLLRGEIAAHKPPPPQQQQQQQAPAAAQQAAAPAPAAH